MGVQDYSKQQPVYVVFSLVNAIGAVTADAGEEAGREYSAALLEIATKAAQRTSVKPLHGSYKGETELSFLMELKAFKRACDSAAFSEAIAQEETVMTLGLAIDVDGLSVDSRSRKRACLYRPTDWALVHDLGFLGSLRDPDERHLFEGWSSDGETVWTALTPEQWQLYERLHADVGGIKQFGPDWTKARQVWTTA